MATLAELEHTYGVVFVYTRDLSFVSPGWRYRKPGTHFVACGLSESGYNINAYNMCTGRWEYPMADVWLIRYMRVIGHCFTDGHDFWWDAGKEEGMTAHAFGDVVSHSWDPLLGVDQGNTGNEGRAVVDCAGNRGVVTVGAAHCSYGVTVSWDNGTRFYTDTACLRWADEVEGEGD